MRPRPPAAGSTSPISALAAVLLLACMQPAVAAPPLRPYSIHDTDGDGYLSRQEYQVLVEIRRQRQQHRRGGFLPPPPFEQVDRDADGRIAEQELTEALRYRMFHYHRPGPPWR